MITDIKEKLAEMQAKYIDKKISKQKELFSNCCHKEN